MKPYEMSNRREVCWDEFLIDQKQNVTLRMHRPEKKEIAVRCEADWEGNTNGYGSLVKTPDGWRFYYRACTYMYNADGTVTAKKEVFCMMESRDGKRFTRPNLGLYEYNGTRCNNIVFLDESRSVDNFSVFYDENPDCPADERYKALSSDDKWPNPLLLLYVSADGLRFVKKGVLDVPGKFDSCNVLFWDPITSEYRIYARDFRKPNNPDALDPNDSEREVVRDIQLAVSKDLVHWERRGLLQYDNAPTELQLYTNNIQRYDRAPHMFLGRPTRYLDRSNDPQSYAEMPLGDRHAAVTQYFGREGTAITDSLLMTSRDGLHFNRTDEAFLRPGVETPINWWYGDCYAAYGLAETAADSDGAPNEISFYVGEGYRVQKVHFRRYTVRLDGFFSWSAGYAGGDVLTKPFTFAGETLSVNFSTSAIGDLTVTLCDESGEPIEGYCSGKLFGDSVDRTVRFEKPLAALQGTPVRMRLHLKDCDLYSFRFA